MNQLAKLLNSSQAQMQIRPSRCLEAVRLILITPKSQNPSCWLETVRLIHSPPFASQMRRSFRMWPLQSVGTLFRIIAMIQLI